MNAPEIEAKDMRQVAIHECGHAAVARHYGMTALPMIWRSHANDSKEELTWCGSTFLQPTPNSTSTVRRIGIAGMVAEFMDREDIEEGTLEVAFEESYDFDEWSESDLQASDGWTWDDYREVYSILKRQWQAIVQEGSALIQSSSGQSSRLAS